jgi:hypothetical protein
MFLIKKYKMYQKFRHCHLQRFDEGLVRAPKSARVRHLRPLSPSEETSKRPLSCRTNCSITVFSAVAVHTRGKYCLWLAEISTEISWPE